jgi:hypothetical protein
MKDIVMTARQLSNQHDGECPPGYSGDDCTIKMGVAEVACAALRTDLVHSCYHGSVCIDASNDAGLLDRYCECETSDILVAGLMCEYRATSICTTTEYVSDQFCVNGGLCKSFVKGSAKHPGCTCKTGIWEGEHCEFAHGVLMDDALDMFQERKNELASGRIADSTSVAVVSTIPTIQIGDAVEAEEKAVPLFLVVGSVIAILAVINLSIFVIRVLRQRTSQSCDEEYESISFSSIASPKALHENSTPPPLDVFLSSRKKEGESADEHSIMLSPLCDAHDVELLDAETSRMIEVQFENHELHRNSGFELSNEVYRGSNSSFDIDEESNDDKTGIQHGKIMINCGKTLLHGESSSSSVAADVRFSSLVELDEIDVREKEAIGSLPCLSGGITDSDGDGEVEDDSDEDTYFV